MLRRLPGLGGEILEFDDERLDMRSVSASLRGHCHSLAWALHQRTGWPMVGIQDRSGQLAHMAVITPEGDLLDATGCWELGDLVEEYAIWRDPDFTFEMSAEDVQALSRDPHWRAAQPEALAGLVRLVLQYYDGSRQNLPSPLDTFCFEDKVVYGQEQEAEDEEELTQQLREPLEFFFCWNLRKQLARFIDVQVRRHTPGTEDVPEWCPLPAIDLESNPAGLPASAINEETFQTHIEDYLENLDELEVWRTLEASL